MGCVRLREARHSRCLRGGLALIRQNPRRRAELRRRDAPYRGVLYAGTLNGTSGTDSLDYSLFPGAVTVNLETGSATGVAGGAAGHVIYMENVLGARNAANTLTGASTPLAGNPAINALGNTLSGVLVGGTVADMLTAGGGNSILIGGGGADQLVANAGTPGFDILIGGTTDYDSNPDVLNAFAGAWRNTTGANYAAQVALLRDTGVAANGTLYRLNSAAVHNVAAVTRGMCMDRTSPSR